MEVKLSVGAMSPDISEQLDKFGLVVKGAEKYQRNLNAVTQLFLNGYIPETAAKKARDKIIKDVFKNMQAKAGE